MLPSQIPSWVAELSDSGRLETDLGFGFQPESEYGNAFQQSGINPSGEYGSVFQQSGINPSVPGLKQKMPFGFLEREQKNRCKGPSDLLWATVEVNNIGTSDQNTMTHWLANTPYPLLNIDGRFLQDLSQC